MPILWMMYNWGRAYGMSLYGSNGFSHRFKGKRD